MRQPLPVTSFALLGLLTFGDELTGYELKQRADITLRFYWVAPAMSQIYSELSRLSGLGLVEPTTTTHQGVGRPTTTYRITDAGRDTLRSWMRDTPTGFPVLKHEPALRLLMAHATEPGAVVAMLERYVEQLAAARADLVEVREALRGADAPGEVFRNPSLVAEWGLAHFDSERAIAERTLERLREE